MGIFETNGTFKAYNATLELRGKILGGTPKDPKIIEGWLRSKAGIDDEEEIRQAMLRTLVDLGLDPDPKAPYEQLKEASERLSTVKQTSGFKQDDGGLYIESRTVKAMLKESVNILFAGDKWGKTKKGPRNFFAERVFVNPDHIYLGVTEPTGVDLSIVHVNGPQGPKSSLAYHEYVERPTIEFEVKVLKDEIEPEHWPQIWVHAEENGLGASRSQGFGRFDIRKWEVA